jgi:hypothetical protein
MTLFRTVAVLALLVVAALPSAFGQAADAPRKTVSVLVAAGDRIHLLKIGVMVFGNEYGVVKGPHPGVQEAIFSVIKTELDREGALDVNPLPVDGDRLNAVIAAMERAPRSFWNSQITQLEPAVLELAAECSCDHLLVVSQRRWREVLGTNQTAPGLTHAVSSDGRTLTLVPLDLTLYDVKGRKLLSSTPVGIAFRSQLVIAQKFNQVTQFSEQQLRLFNASIDTPRTVWNPHRYDTDGVRDGLFRLGLRPSCTVVIFENTVPVAQRTDPTRADYRQPPETPAGADRTRC